MVEAGIDDVLVANEVVEPGKIERLVALARRARIGVAVDDREPVAALSQAASRIGVTVDVLIDVDIAAPPLRGRHRPRRRSRWLA